MTVRACSESVLYHGCHKRRNEINENVFPPAAMVRTSQMQKEVDLFSLTLGQQMCKKVTRSILPYSLETSSLWTVEDEISHGVGSYDVRQVSLPQDYNVTSLTQWEFSVKRKTKFHISTCKVWYPLSEQILNYIWSSEKVYSLILHSGYLYF